MAYRYHVTLSEHQKCSIELTDKNLLKKNLKEKLNLDCEESKLVIQCWNSEWEAMENIEDMAHLPDKAKLRLFILDDLVPEEKNRSKESSERVEMVVAGQSSTQEFDQTTEENAHLNHTEQLVKQNLWPIKFIVPKKNFGQCLTRCQREKTPITGKLLTKLTEALYEEVIQYTFYPSSAQYREVTEALIDEYPYLAADVPGSDAVSTWKHAIAHRFRNNRKRKDRDIMRPRKRFCLDTSGECKISCLEDPRKKMIQALRGTSAGCRTSQSD